MTNPASEIAEITTQYRVVQLDTCVWVLHKITGPSTWTNVGRLDPDEAPLLQQFLSASAAEIERLTAQLAKCREATVEECARVDVDYTDDDDTLTGSDEDTNAYWMGVKNTRKAIRALSTGERK